MPLNPFAMQPDPRGVLARGLPEQAPPDMPPPPPPDPAVQLDRYGRDPADVRAMRMERARQQYEQRFGSHAPGDNTASMASQGSQTDLDALIRRLAGAPPVGPAGGMQDHRMNLMRR
jgi:hypothetical protein